MRVNRAMVMVFLLASGCAAPLPEYNWTTDDAALEELSRRAAAVRTLEATCSVLLRDDRGEHINLDGALVAKFPDHLRLRAWKMHVAVFDLTMTPEGVWLDLPQKRSDQENKEVALDEHFRDAWAIVSGGFLQRRLTLERELHWAFVTESHPSASGPQVTCIVDARTLTPVRYTIQDQAGGVMYSARLERYAMFGDIIWPLRIVFAGPGGMLTINIDEAEFNTDLAEQAFVPPRTAVKQ